MASLELDLAASQAAEADSTELTADDQEEDSTEVTADDEIAMTAVSAEQAQDDFGANAEVSGRKIPQSEIIIRTIAVERSAPLADLPADADAAFGQWLGNSGLTPSKH